MLHLELKSAELLLRMEVKGGGSVKTPTLSHKAADKRLLLSG